MALYAKVICVPGIGAVLTVAQAMLHRTAQTATISQIITLYFIPCGDKLHTNIHVANHSYTTFILHISFDKSENRV